MGFYFLHIVKPFRSAHFIWLLAGLFCGLGLLLQLSSDLVKETDPDVVLPATQRTGLYYLTYNSTAILQNGTMTADVSLVDDAVTFYDLDVETSRTISERLTTSRTWIFTAACILALLGAVELYFGFDSGNEIANTHSECSPGSSFVFPNSTDLVRATLLGGVFLCMFYAFFDLYNARDVFDMPNQRLLGIIKPFVIGIFPIIIGIAVCVVALMTFIMAIFDLRSWGVDKFENDDVPRSEKNSKSKRVVNMIQMKQGQGAQPDFADFAPNPHPAQTKDMDDLHDAFASNPPTSGRPLYFSDSENEEDCFA